MVQSHYAPLESTKAQVSGPFFLPRSARRYKCGRQIGISHCGAPGIDSSKAEAYVTDAFLERARYSLSRGEGLILVAEQRELATPAERRMLFLSVIERVVIDPQPKEDRKVRAVDVREGAQNRHRRNAGRRADLPPA